MATRKAQSTRKPAAKIVRKSKPAAKKPTVHKVSAIPKGFHTATPYLIVRGAAHALAFYGKAFGAKETMRMAMPDDTVMHAEFKIGDSMLMIADENLEWGAKAPETLGGSATHVMLYVKNVDAFVERAVSAGATVEMPLSDMFWGDRYGKVRDPFGHLWSIATHVEDVRPREMLRRAAAANMQAPPA